MKTTTPVSQSQACTTGLGKDVTLRTLNWKGGFLTPYFSSLVPCLPLARVSQHTLFPPGHKNAGQPALPGVEKPVPLLGNDIIMYVFSFLALVIFINIFLGAIWKKTGKNSL